MRHMGMKMYLDIHFLTRKILTIGEVQVTMKDPSSRTLEKLSFFSEHLHEIRPPSLIVSFSTSIG
jgi:hypothetical protein